MSGWQPSKSRFGHDGRHEPHSRCGFDWARPFHPPLVRRDGDAVELAVIDNGGGIAEHVLEQVLEPFETTKKDGLGMGLPIVRAGAEDFLTKRAATADLVAAIDRAIGRDARERTERLRCAEARKKVALLSDRELQVLFGIVKGITNREIAEECELSERTVKYHRTMLTRRLDIYASVDLTRLVQDAGITIEELARMASAGKPVRGRSK